MRQIKFRAWDKKLKQIKPVIDIWFGEGVSISHIVIRHHGEVITLFSDFELMQFTGLLDKNGKEIYDGDIVATSDNGIPDEDKWDKEDWGYAKVSIDEDGVHMICGNDYWSWGEAESVFDLKYIEVIGNIYENPELLNHAK